MTNDAWKPLPPETFDIPVHVFARHLTDLRRSLEA